MIICKRLLNNKETDVTQIESNTWIERIYLRSTLSLLIVTLLHINQRMLTCSTVRTKDSWQNDWSQGFRLCDQEEFPYCDTCVKVPYHICMTHVLILPRYLRLLAPCYNPTSKWHRGISTTFKYSNPPGCQLHLWWRCSDPQNSMKNWADLWVTVWKVYWVCQKRNMTNQRSVWWLPRCSFHKRQFSSEMEEIIRQ